MLSTKFPLAFWHFSTSPVTFRPKTNFFFRNKDNFSPFSSSKSLSPLLSWSSSSSSSSFLVYLLVFLPFSYPSFGAPFLTVSTNDSTTSTTSGLSITTIKTNGNDDNVAVGNGDAHVVNVNHDNTDAISDGFDPHDSLSRVQVLVEKDVSKLHADAEELSLNRLDDEDDGSGVDANVGDEDEDDDDDEDDDEDDDYNEDERDDDDDDVSRIFARLLATSPSENDINNDKVYDGEEERMKRAVTQALCPIKQGKHGEDKIAQLTKSTCTQTISQSMCEEDERMEVRRGEIRPLGESRSAAVYYGHELCFSFFSRGATKTDGCMSMCMEKDKEYEVSLDVSGYTRTYWTLKFTGDCYFCGFSQPLTVIACVFLGIVVIAATCCVCCRTDPSRQLSTMHQAMQQQMQKIVNSRNPPPEEAKNPPEEEEEFDPGAETQGDVTFDDDNLNATRDDDNLNATKDDDNLNATRDDDDNLNATRDDDNLNATRDTRSRCSPTGTQPSPSMQSRSEAVTPSAPLADDSRLFDESKDWTDREC